MIGSTSMFDRRINLYFYDTAGSPLGQILTPDIGPKPDIKVEGVILNSNMAISSTVTVTNLERTIDVDSVGFIRAECFYGGSVVEQILRKSFVYKVLYADQSKQPPDRQVCFNCLTAGFSSDLAESYVTITAQKDADGKLLPFTHTQLCSLFIQAYNRSVVALVGGLIAELKLAPVPVYNGTESYANAQIFLNEGTYSLYDMLDILSTSIKNREQLKSDPSKFVNYYPLAVFVEDNALQVVPNPSLNKDTKLSPKFLELTYIKSAYRRGSIVHVSCLFDPRISQSTLIKLSGSAIYGKRTLGAIVPIASESVAFYPVAGIRYVFSTVGENQMDFQGSIPSVSL